MGRQYDPIVLASLALAVVAAAAALALAPARDAIAEDAKAPAPFIAENFARG